MIDQYQDTDARGVAALLCAVPEMSNTTEVAFRSYQQNAQRCGKDFLVLRHDRTITGLLTSTFDASRARNFRISVAPEYRRKGDASRLMRALQEQQCTAIECDSRATWQAGNAFLENQGLVVTRTKYLMRASAKVAQTSPRTRLSLPRGVTVRPARERDAQAWCRLYRAVHSKRADSREMTRADMAMARSQPGFALMVAEYKGEVVGYCHTHGLSGDESAIVNLLVDPTKQKRGIGKALLSSAMTASSKLGRTVFSTSVTSENQIALSVLQGLGFAVHDKLLRYSPVPG